MAQLQVGQTIGPYHIVGVVGQGGMATVYKVEQRALQRFVALKVLAPELARDPDFVARFRREATTAARLEHPHVVPIYDIDQADGVLYIAMRYVPGPSLASLLDQQPGPLPLARSLGLLSQIAEALDYAHSRGVVHRDLKPGNILVEAADRLSLADFGIAVAGGATRLTRLGTVAGTPEYMAPEQAQGGSVDHRADLYALGIIAYELLGGRTPFQADSGVAILHQQLYAAPPPLHGVPAAVEAAIQRMLAKAPEARFPSAASFVAALRGAPQPTPGPPPLPHPRAASRRQLHPRPCPTRPIPCATTTPWLARVTSLPPGRCSANASSRASTTRPGCTATTTPCALAYPR